MKQLFFLALTLIQLSTCVAQPAKNANKLNKSELTPEIDALVQQYIDLDIFSGVVLLAEHGQPIYHKAFGLANRETNTPNTLITKFDIGSMNKTFTKTLILQLIEQGKIKFSDKLGDYLTGFPKIAADNITITHLLNHSSGYGDYFSREYMELPINKRNIDNLVELIKKMPLYFEPGTDSEYSNAGYILLGAIIEKVTEKQYTDIVKERITIPLGMTETYVENILQIPDRAIGYSKTMKGELENNNEFTGVSKPDGGFQSTTSDILTFYREFHYGEKILKKETKMLDEFYNAIQAHTTTGGAIPHAGGFNGANTVNYEILRDDITLIVFANMDEPVAEQLGAGILAIIRGQKPNPPSLPAIQMIYQSYKQHGLDHIRNNFEQLTTNFHPTDPRDMILNSVGYEFLHDGAVDDAIAVFKLNTELFSEVGNTWDSLGEAYRANGNKEKAIASYKKALALDPELPSAHRALKELTTQ